MTRALPRVLTHLPKGLLDKVFASYPGIEVIEVPSKGEMPPGTEGQVLLTQTIGAPNLALVLRCGVESWK